jgi:hypothetical protein
MWERSTYLGFPVLNSHYHNENTKNNQIYYYSMLLPYLLTYNSYLCNQLGNALFCVTSGIFAGRAQRDHAKSHELHKIAFPTVLHTRFFLILTKKKFLQTLKRSNEFH